MTTTEYAQQLEAKVAALEYQLASAHEEIDYLQGELRSVHRELAYAESCIESYRSYD